jgi:glycosyltransferase involved in cell wall biosynthesis
VRESVVKDPKVACVIPALNAAPTVGNVITGLRASLDSPFIIVIDDGSSDDTGAVARTDADATLRFRRNRGKGAALRAGFELALEQTADVVLTIDADGQHDPRVAPTLVEAVGGADLIIGARDRSVAAMPAGRRLTNRLSAAAVAKCIRREVADAQSGFRAMRAQVAGEVKPRGDRYEFETEFLILAAHAGYRIGFVPIPTIYGTQVGSHFRTVRDSARIVGTLWRFGVGAGR